jgi:hypothetical protein
MGLLVDPVALGGLAGLIAIGSWAVGLMQGGANRLQGPQVRPGKTRAKHPLGEPAGAPDSAVRAVRLPAHRPDPAAAVLPECRERILAERRALLASPLALAELHAEASAIRRAERIFACDTASDMAFAPFPVAQAVRANDCRYAGLAGWQACLGPGRSACALAGDCGAVQPSPDSAPSVRV